MIGGHVVRCPAPIFPCRDGRFLACRPWLVPKQTRKQTSNYGKRKKAVYVYLTATVDAAIWGEELAVGEGPRRIYIVEPSGSSEDDPNLTDKRFPGNPTKSYRTRHLGIEAIED